MEKTYSKQELFESVPVSKAILSLAIPTVISQLINLLYNIVDTFFIGRVGNSYLVAAVTVSYTIFMLNNAFGNLFGIGGGSLMARLIGRGKEADARKVSAYAFYCAVIFSCLYGLIILVFEEPLLRFLGASDITLPYAKQYVNLTVVFGSVPMVLSLVLGHMLRNLGYAKQASLGLSGGGLLNMMLDPLLMFVLLPKGMEVFGAALATLLSNSAACIFLIVVYCMLSRTAPCSARIHDARQLERAEKRELYSVGVPSALLTGLFDIANVVLNRLMSIHGDLQLAAIGIVMKAYRLPNAINVGISQGMLPIVAYNYSSGNRKRMQDAIRTSRIYGLTVAAASIVFYQLLARPISGVFLSASAGNVQESMQTLAYAALFLRIQCLTSPVQYLNFHASSCLQAMGNGRATLLHAFIREILIYIPLMYLLDTLAGENALAAALPLAELISALPALYLVKRTVQKAKEN